MPLFDRTGIPQDRLGTPVPPDVSTTPPALDVAAASLRQSSLVGGAYETAVEGGFKGTPPQSGYDPLDDIQGYEEFATRFLSSRSPQETATIKQRLQSDMADRRTLGQAGGWGVAASMAAGISDPINLAFAAIPIAGAGRVAGLVKGAAGGALIETPIQLAQESLHPVQTREESILNVGTAAILTGLLGSAVSRSVPRGTFEEAASAMAKDTAPFEGSTAGAAAVGFKTTLEQEGVGTGGGFIAKTLGQGSPLTRMMTSPTKSTRVLAQKLADIPYVVKKNESGIATGTSVEKRIEQYNGLRVTDISARDDAYLTYRTGAKKAGQDVLSREEFSTQVSAAMRREDAHSIPEIAAEAARTRKTIIDPITKEAQNFGQLKKELKLVGAKSYLPRLYNVPKIKAHLSDWNARGFDWLVGQGTDPAEAKAIMDEYTNKVLGTTRGFVDLDPSVVVKSGPLRERTVNIPDEILEPYLHSNIERVVGQYLHTVAPQIELARGLGVDEANPSIAQAFENEVNRIKDEYAILKNKYLKPAGVTERLTAKLSTREAEAEYNALKDTRGGKVLSVDAARELSPDYLKNRTLSADVHEPASAFIKRQYAKKLAEAPKAGEEPEVIFNAGGTGAGKTTGLDLLAGEADRAQIIYDTNMDSYGSSVTKIEQALKAGKAVKILYTFRDPLEALREGALTRAMRQEGTFGSGRTVPLESHIKTHKGSRATVEKLIEKYQGDERVQIRVIDNSRGRGNAIVSSLEKLPAVDYTKLREKALQVLDEEHAAGRISEPVYQGFKQGEGGPPRSGVRGEPQSQRDARAADKTVAALTDREKADIRDAVAMRDRVLGKYGIPEDPDSMIVRGARLMRTYTYITKGGSFVLASFGDIGRIVSRYGMTQTAGAVTKFATRLANWGVTRTDAKRIGAGTEWALSTRGRSWAEIGDLADTRIEEVSQKFANQFTRVSGMATWNSTLKFLATALEQDSILKLAQTGKLGKNDVVKLAEAGIDSAMLGRIAEQFRKFGETDGIRRGRTALWDDKEAAVALEQALLKQSDIVVLSPGRGDAPLFMSKELFKTLFQFKGFGMAAVNRLLIPAAQGMARGDLKMLNGMMLMLGLGSLSYIAKQFASDQPIDTSAGRLMAEAVDKSGFSAYLSDPYDIAADIAGLPRLSRFSDRSWIETAAGPAVGTAVDIGMALKGMAKDGVSQRDIHKIRKLLPYQNLWYARRAINWMEDSTVDALGIPKQARQ